VRTGVKRLVHASSVSVYSPGPKDRRVDESWPAGGSGCDSSPPGAPAGGPSREVTAARARKR
jgi:nucleoside-diphosphate-sugar epimerase